MIKANLWAAILPAAVVIAAIAGIVVLGLVR